MKKYLLLLVFISAFSFARSQNVGIGTSTPNVNAKLDIVDSTGGILIPRMDSLHRVRIPNTQGLMVYETNTNSFWYNDGIKWYQINIVPPPAAPVADQAALSHLYLIKGF